MDRQPKSLAQAPRRTLAFFPTESPPLRSCAEADRPQSPARHTLNHTLQIVKVVALSLALQRLQPLRRNPKRIRHRDANSAGAHVKAKNPAPGSLRSFPSWERPRSAPSENACLRRNPRPALYSLDAWRRLFADRGPRLSLRPPKYPATVNAHLSNNLKQQYWSDSLPSTLLALGPSRE